MPGWLQAVANWNPLSALAAACRHLFGNPETATTVTARPRQHPVLTVILIHQACSRCSPPARKSLA